MKNCKVPKTYDKCSVCEFGHYLNESEKCIRNSFEIIDNCEKYSNGTTCEICKAEYYLLNNKCVAVDKIDNCVKYSRT